MFPKESINVRGDITGNGTSTIVSVPNGSTYTILYESYNTSSTDASSQFSITCLPIYALHVNSLKNNPQIERFKYTKCTTDIAINVSNTTGSPETTYSVIYAPYDMALSSTTPYSIPTTTVPASTQDIFTTNIILIVIATILMLDFIRRLFAPHQR